MSCFSDFEANFGVRGSVCDLSTRYVVGFYDLEVCTTRRGRPGCRKPMESLIGQFAGTVQTLGGRRGAGCGVKWVRGLNELPKEYDRLAYYRAATTTTTTTTTMTAPRTAVRSRLQLGVPISSSLQTR